MTVNKQQSAIKEARDQLFLDTADGVRLNVVTSNLGLDRPLTGIDDDEWRAIAKNIGLQPKLVRNAFARLLEICVGPKKTLIATLAEDTIVGDALVQGVDSSDLLQLGTLVFSPGQVTEETISFCFRDLETHKIFLNDDLVNVHTAVAEALGHLLADTASGAATLDLISTKTFPTVGFPYSIILARATETEETVVVTGNDTLLNRLTLLNPTVNDQPGPRPTFIKKALDVAAPNGQTFVRFDADDTRVWPNFGFIRLAFGLAAQETREYESNDIDNSVIFLRRPLESDHVAGEALELVTPGATIETCSVIQLGVDWQILETEPRKIKVFAPSLDTNLRLQDSSWFHDEVPPAFATTLANPTIATDLVLDITDISGFPDEAGLILVDGTITRFYVLRDELAGPPAQLVLTEAIGSILPGGTAVSLIREVYIGTDLEEGNILDLLGAFTENKFTGPYLYDINQRAPSIINTALAVAIPPPTSVVADTIIGQTCVEVEDAFSWPAPPFTPFGVRLGRDTGSTEDTTIVDRTLKISATTTVDVSPAPNPGGTTLQGVDTTAFPQSNGINPANYRIIIDEGGANEEILTVLQNSATVPGVFTLSAGTTIAHAPGETIGLLSDVLTFDPLIATHTGPQVNPTVVGHPVEPLIETIELVSGVDFRDDGGTVYINFGKERINVRARITAVVSPTILEFADTSIFPDATDPYAVRVGEGLPAEESASVVVNNTGLNRLTMSAALVGTFAVGDYIEFKAGVPATFVYVDRDTNTLDLAQPTVFPSGYTKGETVIFSPSESVPSVTGTSYPLLMPPDATICLASLFDIVRAAGVEIEFLETT